MCSARGFPFSTQKLQLVAFELASKNKQKGPDKKKAENYWLQNFLKRYPYLVIKETTNLSINRAMEAKNPSKLLSSLMNTGVGLRNGKSSTTQTTFGMWMSVVFQMFQKRPGRLGKWAKRYSKQFMGKNVTNSTLLCFISAGGLECPPPSSYS